MVRVTFRDSDGTAHEVEAQPGRSLMEAAVAQGVAGILAECGGNMACGTCHVRVDPSWYERVGPPGEGERMLLEGVAFDLAPTSRLSCQIQVTADLEGLVVELPSRQL